MVSHVQYCYENESIYIVTLRNLQITSHKIYMGKMNKLYDMMNIEEVT